MYFNYNIFRQDYLNKYHLSVYNQSNDKETTTNIKNENNKDFIYKHLEIKNHFGFQKT